MKSVELKEPVIPHPNLGILTHAAGYEVRFIVGEWWSTYATCQHRQHAEEIEQMLLARGKTTRIVELRRGIVLGEAKKPEAKTA